MKKFFVGILTVCIFLTMGMALTACNSGTTQPEHTHTYASEWSYDENYHWYSATCEHTNEIKGKVTHEFNGNGICTACGYEKGEGEHVHSYSPTWSYNGEYHYHESTCGHEVVSDKALHNFEGDSCSVCPYVREHIHTFDTNLSRDENYHWYAATCGHNVVNGKEEHNFNTNDTCVCGQVAVYTKGLSYAFDDTSKTYTVTGLGETTEKDIVIADSIDGYPVKYIGTQAFKDSNITSITFGKNIAKVESSAFKNCANLVTVNINNDCSLFENECFMNCTSLERIEIPKNSANCSVGTRAFNGCTSLEYADIGSVKYLGSELFVGCSSLVEVVADNITAMGYTIFTGCVNLERFDIPTAVQDLSGNDFDDTKLIKPYNGVKYVGTWAVGLTDNFSSQSLSFKSDTTGIDCYAFENEQITDLYLPASLVHLDGAFGNIKTKLSNIHLEDLESYLRLNIGEWGPVSSLKKYYMFLNGTELNKLVIPESITKIPAGAFYNCLSIVEVVLHDGIEEIGARAFGNCINMNGTEYMNGKYVGVEGGDMTLISIIDKTATTFTFHPNTSVISESAFADSKNLEGIVIPDTVKIIGSAAFAGCSKLESVTLPNSLTEIDERVFYMCTSLKNITIPDGVETVKGGAFYKCTSLTAFPFSSTSKLKTIDDYVTITGFATKFGAFEGSALTEINFPTSLSYIGERAFYNCSGLTNLTIGSSVNTIGRWAFEKSGLVNLTINGTQNTVINQYAFQNSSKLESIDITARWIKGYAFYNCKILNNVQLHDGLTTINQYSFQNCISLYTITIPSTVTAIGKDAFKGCEKLLEIRNLSEVAITAGDVIAPFVKRVYKETNDSNMSKVGDYVFFTENGTKYLLSYLGKEKQLTLPVVDGGYEIYQNAFIYSTCEKIIVAEGVTKINNKAFSNCTELTELQLSSTVTSLSSNALYVCRKIEKITVDVNNQVYSSLDGILYNKDVTEIILVPYSIQGEIVIPDTVTVIPEEAFCECESVTAVILPVGLLEIKDYAFCYCPSLTIIRYNGTQEQWDAIVKGEGWNEDTDCSIECLG